LERDYFHDFFTSNKSADLIISIICIFCFAFGNAFFAKNYFGSVVIINVFICLGFGIFGYYINRLFFNVCFAIMLQKNLTKVFYKEAFFRFTLIGISFVMLIKGSLLAVFNEQISFSAVAVPIIYTVFLSICFLVITSLLVKGNFIRATKSELIRFVIFPFFVLGLLKIVLLGVL